MSRAWSKDIYVEPHTFGGTKACEVLADMMNQNLIPVYEKHRVLAFINMATCQFKGVSTLSDRRVKNPVLSLVRDNILSKIDLMPYPPKFLSYLKNVIAHHYRKALERVV